MWFTYGGFVQITSGVTVVTTPVFVAAEDQETAEAAMRERAAAMTAPQDRIDVSLTPIDLARFGWTYDSEVAQDSRRLDWLQAHHEVARYGLLNYCVRVIDMSTGKNFTLRDAIDYKLQIEADRNGDSLC